MIRENKTLLTLIYQCPTFLWHGKLKCFLLEDEDYVSEIVNTMSADDLSKRRTKAAENMIRN